VWAAIAEPANVLVRADVPVAGLGAWAAAATVVALTLSLWPARRAARLRPAEALRSE
jgi:ABC-type lipoprotein release transport system permease subunit